MGMAASQVRLLQLTARKNDIGYQLQNLSLQKSSLSRDMQRVTKEYQNALNTKTLKWSNNSGVTYVDLSYANLMRPGSVNNNVPYLITNGSGNVVVDSQYQKYAEMISPDGSAGGDYESVRTKILSSLCGISADEIAASEAAQADVVAAENRVNTLMNEVDEAREKAKSKGNLTEFLECFGNSWQGVSKAKTTTSASTVKQDYEDSNQERCWILDTTAEASQSKLESMINQICTSVCNNLDTKDAEAFQKACNNTIEEYKTYIATAGEQNGDTKHVAKDNAGPASGKYVVNIYMLINAILSNYSNNGGTVEQNQYGTDVYTYFDKESDEYKTYKEKEAELETAKEELTKYVDVANQCFTSADESTIEFYDKLFSAIADNGWEANSQISDNDYLNQMLQNNQYYITTMEEATDDEGKTCYEYSDSIASNFGNIFIVNDTDAQNEAQIEYEYEKSIINEKETRIDTRMQNLETEQSAINEMIKGIESVRDDNTDRTFSIFS